MARREGRFVDEHPILALAGVAVLVAVVDVAVSLVANGRVDPLVTGAFVVALTGLYAVVLWRNGTLTLR